MSGSPPQSCRAEQASLKSPPASPPRPNTIATFTPAAEGRVEDLKETKEDKTVVRSGSVSRLAAAGVRPARPHQQEPTTLLVLYETVSPPPVRDQPRPLHLLGYALPFPPVMAPPQPFQQPEAAAAAGAGAISKVLIVMAMEKEAMPLVYKFNLVEAPPAESIFPKGAPWTRFSGNYKDLQIDLVMPGKDTVLGVDSVGTVSAALVTFASIQALKPDIIINAGTCGGFKAKGACVKDVFLASDVAFHDRRIPIPVFDMYGIGARKTLAAPNILKELNFKLGKLSTGDSLDMSPQDEEAILSNDATIKDMEGAAVAYVADMFSTPAIYVKAVTDIVDGDKPTAEEFLQNLLSVTAALDEAVTKVVEFISSGKRISDL